MKSGLIIGHRGASYLAPENTLASFNLAWELGVQAVELDVRMTSDKKIIVFHDSDTKRLAGIKKVIAETSYSELQKLDIGSFKGEKWKGENIPLLTDVLATVPATALVFIEVKGGEEMIPFLERIIFESHLLPQQVNFLAFNPTVAELLKRTFADHLVCLNFDQTTIPLTNSELLLKLFSESNLDGVDISVEPPIKNQLVEELHGHDKKVFVWVVDDPQEAKRLLKMGVDGIISNRPAWLREQLKV